MDGNHPKNADPRPKRRRDKDNPYMIFTTDGNTANPHYYLAFTDGSGDEQCVEIDKALFDAFDRFELEDISFMHKVDKHYERAAQECFLCAEFIHSGQGRGPATSAIIRWGQSLK